MATKKTTRKSNNGARQMDAIRVIERDHETLRKLLGELEKTTDRSTKHRRELLGRIGEEVRTHARIEEEIFYPAYREAVRSKEDNKIYLEANEEHALVDVVLPQLEGTDPAAEEFGARAKVLKDLIEHHAEEEENEMLPRAKKLLGKERLVELGEQLAARKEELMGSGGLTGWVTFAGRKLSELRQMGAMRSGTGEKTGRTRKLRRAS